MLGVNTKLQNGATTGNGTVLNLGGEVRELTFYIEADNAVVSAGAVQVETAHDPSYAGTWAPLGSPVTIVQNTVKIVQATGSFIAVRARISTDVTGGAVCTVRAVGNME